MTLEMVDRFVEAGEPAGKHFPPTLLYNEGWLLRLVLNWFHKNRTPGHPLFFEESATWYSEALLPTPFRASRRGDTHAESRTHADGVIGHFSVGVEGKADLQLDPGATQLVVLEAKLLSPLSPRVRAAPDYDQAARSVACLAEALRRGKRPPAEMSTLGFILLAPIREIESRDLAAKLDRGRLQAAVGRRMSGFARDLSSWYQSWFLPTLECIDLKVVAWEELIRRIAANEPVGYRALQTFYDRCLVYGAARAPTPVAKIARRGRQAR
jgi:hypothetical protein